eukprot:TRINITY_DN4136_c0_g1_i1.p1 TRINITY_DN4136_c0_g1~~TRINITY_DN4136_c0_g1_i1.p1  ORF type:complete len:296 (+),score=81.14 TRINITY_DN4136_c0_g1_i1:79-966(+)
MLENDFGNLLGVSWDKSQIEYWLKEDIPSFDYGGFVVGDKEEKATLFCKAPGILAGVPFFQQVFEYLGCKVEWHFKEGTYLDPSNEEKKRLNIATVTGPSRKILVGERTALNILARCSGIATKGRELKNLADKSNYNGCIAGTRKTTPGFRVVEKYGILVGGCDPHRMDLSSMIMLKDNHIWSTGSITNAVKKAKLAGGFAMKIDVECRSIEEANEAAKAGADIVMLDNYSPEELKTASKELKKNFPHVLIEASGGITVSTIEQYFDPSVDIISMGSLTQGVPHIDFSLKINQTK